MARDVLPAPVLSRRTLLGALSTLAWPACQQRPGTTAPTTEEGLKVPPKPAGITYQQRTGPSEDFVRKVYGPAWEQQTGIKLVIEDIPAGELWTKIPALFAAGQLGDLVFGWNAEGVLALWAYHGLSIPLDPYVKADKYDVKQFYEGCIEACQFEGKLHALPTVGHPGEVTLFQNLEMFDAAGLKPIDARWTFDALVDAARRLTRDTDGDGTPNIWGYHSGRSWFQLIVRLRAFGGDIFSEDGRRCVLNTPQAKAAWQWEYDLIHRYRAAPPPGTQGVDFLNGSTLAISSNNIANVTLFKPQIGTKFRWQASAWPPGPSGRVGATVHVNTTHVTSQSKHPYWAWDFLKYICSHEVGVQKVLMNSGSPGGRPDVWNDPRLHEYEPIFREGARLMQEARAPRYAYNLKTAEAHAAMLDIAAALWRNELGPSEAAEKMVNTIQPILDQPR